MLSSVASRVYWVARYLERAENTARLIQAYTSLSLDLPREIESDWAQLVQVCGAVEDFDTAGRGGLEKSVVLFLSADLKNKGSILASIRSARENLRTLREVVPKEAFETVNELYHFANQRLSRVANRRLRFEILNEIIERCQLVTGLMAGTMSQSGAYQFIRLGRNLERADMTTRMIDMGSELLSKEDKMAAEHVTTMWVNVLRSLSAYQSYRQTVQSRITAVRVLYFLLADKDFPRAVTHCLIQLQTCVDGLPHNEAVIDMVQAALDQLNGLSLRNLARDTLHEDIDQLQLALGDIHASIVDTWITPRVAAL